MPPTRDVLIVGAGAAGLAAAVRLHEAGLSVTVLEGRRRAGGRIHTLQDAPGAGVVELGAEFVHGAARLTRGILREAGAEVIPIRGGAWRAGHGRIEPGDVVWKAIAEVLGAPDPERDPDRSLADFLRAEGGRFEPTAVEAVSAFVGGFYAADLERISERALAQDQGQGAADSARPAERSRGSRWATRSASRPRARSELGGRPGAGPRSWRGPAGHGRGP